MGGLGIRGASEAGGGMDAAHCVQVPAHTQQTDTLFAIETERRALMESGFD